MESTACPSLKLRMVPMNTAVAPYRPRAAMAASKASTSEYGLNGCVRIPTRMASPARYRRKECDLVAVAQLRVGARVFHVHRDEERLRHPAPLRHPLPDIGHGQARLERNHVFRTAAFFPESCKE